MLRRAYSIFVCATFVLVPLFSHVSLAANPIGELDPTFGNNGLTATDITPNGNDQIYALVPQNNKTLALGVILGPGGTRDLALVRYNFDGSLDNTFGISGVITASIPVLNAISGMSVQGDGSIVIAGWAGSGPGSAAALARFTPNGTLDNTFDADGVFTMTVGASAYLLDVQIQPNNRIVAAGYSLSSFVPGSSVNAFVLRVLPSGQPDSTFDADGVMLTDFGSTTNYAVELALQADGKIVAAGYTKTGPTDFDYALMRLSADGSLDLSFDGDGKVTSGFTDKQDLAATVAAQSDGKIVVAGQTQGSSIQGQLPQDFFLTRFNADGSPDESFGSAGKVVTVFAPGTVVTAAKLVMTKSQKILLCGSVGQPNSAATDFALLRYDDTGVLDPVFSGDGKQATDFGGNGSTDNEACSTLAVQVDGQLLAGGRSNQRFALARYYSESEPMIHVFLPVIQH